MILFRNKDDDIVVLNDDMVVYLITLQSVALGWCSGVTDVTFFVRLCILNNS